MKFKKIQKRTRKAINLKRGDIQKIIAKKLLQKGWDVSFERIVPGCAAEIIATNRKHPGDIFLLVILVKKYKESNPVKVRDIMHLEFLMSRVKASAGIVITTSRYTESALRLIEECEYKMAFIYTEQIEEQIYDTSEEDDGSELSF